MPGRDVTVLPWARWRCVPDAIMLSPPRTITYRHKAIHAVGRLNGAQQVGGTEAQRNGCTVHVMTACADRSATCRSPHERRRRCAQGFEGGHQEIPIAPFVSGHKRSARHRAGRARKAQYRLEHQHQLLRYRLVLPRNIAMQTSAPALSSALMNALAVVQVVHTSSITTTFLPRKKALSMCT